MAAVLFEHTRELPPDEGRALDAALGRGSCEQPIGLGVERDRGCLLL
jgi:hypothetical protein